MAYRSRLTATTAYLAACRLVIAVLAHPKGDQVGLSEALETRRGTIVRRTVPRSDSESHTRTSTASAAAAGIVFNPGPELAVSADNSGNCLRLCFAMPSKQTIRDGVAELARVCYEQSGIPLRRRNAARPS
jgi:DNA-binding transcriptional MocR family regulator